MILVLLLPRVSYWITLFSSWHVAFYTPYNWRHCTLNCQIYLKSHGLFFLLLLCGINSFTNQKSPWNALNVLDSLKCAFDSLVQWSLLVKASREIHKKKKSVNDASQEEVSSSSLIKRIQVRSHLRAGINCGALFSYSILWLTVQSSVASKISFWFTQQ